VSTELVHVSSTDVLLPVDVNAAKHAMHAYQTVVSAILEPTDWQGRPNREGSFVKKSGWRKIAKAYGLSGELADQSVERADNGQPLRAQAVYRAIAPNGQHMDGVGFCSVDEPRFEKEKGRLKLENDLRATAATRAANRAISDLVGFGQVSAEEMDAAPAPHTPASVYGPPAGEQLAREAAQAVQHVLPDVDGFGLVRVLARTFDDELPEVAARTLKALKWWAANPESAGTAFPPDELVEQPHPDTDRQE
jgi:hypothetical protein